MFEWLRKIPHPGYGKCGGANRDCSISKPRDWMDIAFEQHDNELQEAKTDGDRKKADMKLGTILREGNPKKLTRKIYGRVYLFFAKMFFKP